MQIRSPQWVPVDVSLVVHRQFAIYLKGSVKD